MDTEQEDSLSELQLAAQESHDSAWELHNTGKYALSKKKAELGVELYQKLPLPNQDRDKIFSLKKLIASNYLILNNLDVVSVFLEELLDNTIHIFGENHINVAEVYNQLGYLHSYLLADDNKGIEYKKKCLEIRLNALGDNRKKIAFSYNNMACSYGRMGEYEKEGLYFLKAMNLRQEICQEIDDDLAASYHNLGIYYDDRLNDHQRALDYLHKALDMRIQIWGESNYYCALTSGNLGDCYCKNGDTDTGLRYQLKALSIYQNLFGKNNYHTTNYQRKVAVSYMRLGKYQLALDLLQAAWDALEVLYDRWHIQKIHVLTDWGEVLLKQGKTYEALKKILQALQQYLKEEAEVQNGIHSLYQIDDFIETSNSLSDTLVYKARFLTAHYEMTSHDKEDLKCALEHYWLAKQLTEAKRSHYKTEKSRLLFAKMNPVYEGGIQLACRTDIDLPKRELKTRAFDFTESAKAVALLSVLGDVAAKMMVQISADLLEKERNLKKRLIRLDKLLQAQQNTPKENEDEEEQLLLRKRQNEFFDLHQQYTALLQQLETDYPDYYQLKYDTKTATPTELQSILQENQTLVSYFIGEDSIYIFVITADEFEVEELQKPDDLEGMIQQFLESIHAHDKSQYLQLAHALYELLIAPVELHWFDDWSDLLGEETSENSPQQLIIIPHAELSYLPFEALISGRVEEDTPYSALKYLVKQYEISYHYSATLWQYAQQNKGERAETEHSFVGFAPVYEEEVRSRKQEVGNGISEVGGNVLEDGSEGALKLAAKEMAQWATRSEALRSDGTWTPLPHSKEETENIAALFEGKGLNSETYLHEQATKEQFQKAVGKARYLLVAAHGVVNDEKTALSGLVFYPNTVDGGRQTVDGTGILNNEHRTPNHESSITNHQNDCILSMEETYPLNIQADLVVLSSCESGIGKLHKGEGMMAVNRGFLAAGAKNVISTLFKVYDKPSSLLTQYLFEAILEQGDDYTAALRTAKLKLLEQEGVNPKSWCGFVLIGG